MCLRECAWRSTHTHTQVLVAKQTVCLSCCRFRTCLSSSTSLSLVSVDGYARCRRDRSQARLLGSVLTILGRAAEVTHAGRVLCCAAVCSVDTRQPKRDNAVSYVLPCLDVLCVHLLSLTDCRRAAGICIPLACIVHERARKCQYVHKTRSTAHLHTGAAARAAEACQE